MQVIVQGQHLDVGEALRGHVEEKLTDTCTRYFNHSIQSNVYFTREASGFRTDITLSVGNGILLKSTANAHDPYPAFDQANDKLVRQLKKYKERLKDHHAEQGKSALKFLPANEYTFADRDALEHGEGGDAPVTLAELPTHLPTLAVADAVMRMDLADLNAFLFRNAAHGRLNMVYRRKDGNIGWVDPQDGALSKESKQESKKPAKKPTAKKPAAKKTKASPKKPAKKKAVVKSQKTLKKSMKKTARKPVLPKPKAKKTSKAKRRK